jgi:putative molybdopterin biosynthesis protein
LQHYRLVLQDRKPDFLTTGEVAEFLRVKERTVYELVRTRRIPCSRATGRLLFPKSLVEAWVRSQVEYEGPRLEPPPPVIAGSHDPLLDWAVRESGCELALMSGGSLDGLRRLELGQALAAGLHLLEPAGGYNAEFLRRSPRGADLVLIHWAWRDQGLITATRNPKKIRGVADLVRPGIVIACRQEGAGSQLLLRHLLERAGLAYSALKLLEPAMRTESDVAAAVLDGQADCGLGIAAAARRHRLGFLPLHRERFDIAVAAQAYFEEGFQRLLWFARDPAFAARAAALGGYDVSQTGRVMRPAG